jgi:hypothetical protein
MLSVSVLPALLVVASVPFLIFPDPSDYFLKLIESVFLCSEEQDLNFYS